jgi:hypothetical protein
VEQSILAAAAFQAAWPAVKSAAHHRRASTFAPALKRPTDLANPASLRHDFTRLGIRPDKVTTSALSSTDINGFTRLRNSPVSTRVIGAEAITYYYTQIAYDAEASGKVEWLSATAPIVVGIVALAGLAVCGLISALASTEVVDKVNDRLPADSRFALLGWHHLKTQRLYGEYQRLYPDGPLLFRVRVSVALMLVCIAVCVWAFGVPRP